MSNYLCHDFKTPRNDTSKRLPDSFKAIPVLFYVALIAAAYFMTMDWLAYKQAEQDKLQAVATKKQHEESTKALDAEKAEIDAETAKAELLAKWMEGARNLQPIGAAISRSMPNEVRLSDLLIERSEQVPSNLSLSVRINGGSSKEVGLMEASLSRLQYRALAAQLTKEGEVVQYRSTIVRGE
ncbi:MAG: hypothetical protein NTV80_02425 [Verrucomicrobia bacterium]|nr:hypothetical protein [Verrucomicrobiota bacterium]